MLLAMPWGGLLPALGEVFVGDAQQNIYYEGDTCNDCYEYCEANGIRCAYFMLYAAYNVS